MSARHGFFFRLCDWMNFVKDTRRRCTLRVDHGWLENHRLRGQQLGWRHPFWWGGSNHTARVWQVFWGMFTEILCIGLGWCHIMTPNYWGLMEFHQTYLMFQLVQKVGECREFLLSVGTLTSKVRKGSKLRHWMIWPQLVYREILFSTFSGVVELINDHLINTTRCTFLWHGGF